MFAGDGASSDSINGIVYIINDFNNQNTNNKTFLNYSLTDKVNSKILSSQDVLIIPGGDFEIYISNPNIKSADIKKFVSGGKGFVGICAGAYAASSYIDGYHAGWGIAPHIYSKFYNFDGQLNVSFTSYGQDILNYSDTKRLSVANGPSMYKEGSYTPLARYNTITMHRGHAAILDDTYGSGRVIISSPHPELYPRESGLLLKMILWASGKT
ncbi:MAG: BPL-N domain-containing protein [Methanobacteriaceae archaeon]|nr:BPL-N domain-containing protein [Methanobacteriaceae archaeon]